MLPDTQISEICHNSVLARTFAWHRSIAHTHTLCGKDFAVHLTHTRTIYTCWKSMLGIVVIRRLLIVGEHPCDDDTNLQIRVYISKKALEYEKEHARMLREY